MHTIGLQRLREMVPPLTFVVSKRPKKSGTESVRALHGM
jgi:hypothetical protein